MGDSLELKFYFNVNIQNNGLQTHSFMHYVGRQLKFKNMPFPNI